MSQLEKEKTHIIEQQLEDGAGTIRLLLTVSGTVGHEISSDLANYTPDAQFRDKIISRYVCITLYGLNTQYKFDVVPDVILRNDHHCQYKLHVFFMGQMEFSKIYYILLSEKCYF